MRPLVWGISTLHYTTTDSSSHPGSKRKEASNGLAFLLNGIAYNIIDYGN